jgi:D-amino-acid oxidase
MSSNIGMKNIVVIGAGVVGLSVALKLLEDFNGSVNVTIVADRFLQQTLTYSCGGLWEPYQIAGTPDEQINKWGKVAFEHFKSLSNGPDAAKSGVQLLTAYQALEIHQDATPPTWRDIVHNFKVLSVDDLTYLGLPSKYVSGFTFGTYVIEQKYYMHYLTERLTALGAQFEQRLVENLNELSDRDCDCIVNCTGLGAKDLLGDEEMYPVRGQVLRVRL